MMGAPRSWKPRLTYQISKSMVQATSILSNSLKQQPFGQPQIVFCASHSQLVWLLAVYQ